jgi:hypothetical protein
MRKAPASRSGWLETAWGSPSLAPPYTPRLTLHDWRGSTGRSPQQRHELIGCARGASGIQARFLHPLDSRSARSDIRRPMRRGPSGQGDLTRLPRHYGGSSLAPALRSSDTPTAKGPRMAVYRIVCVHRLVAPTLASHGHVIAVGTVDQGALDSAPTASWTAAELIRAAREGDRFTLGAPGAAVPVAIARRTCSQCASPSSSPIPRTCSTAWPTAPNVGVGPSRTTGQPFRPPTIAGAIGLPGRLRGAYDPRERGGDMKSACVRFAPAGRRGHRHSRAAFACTSCSPVPAGFARG